MSHQLAVIYGSVRHHRQGIRAARFVINKLQERGHKVDFIDAKAQDLPLLDKMYKEFGEGEAPENLANLANILKRAEGYVIVSGEYNHSVPPALKNLLDHFQSEYLFKPSAIACYSAGIFGGVRAAVHLRAVLAELGMPSISSIFPVPNVQKAFNENGEPFEEAYHDRIKKFLNEFDWYVDALNVARQKGKPF